MHFSATRHVLSAALVDLDHFGELMERWNNSSPEIQNDRRIVLSVDAFFVRPRVTIANDGSVNGLEDITWLESPDFSEQYLRNSKEFVVFLTKHWNQADSALFAFQLQSILPSLSRTHLCLLFRSSASPLLQSRSATLEAILSNIPSGTPECVAATSI
jgi:hypothetical protein